MLESRPCFPEKCSAFHLDIFTSAESTSVNFRLGHIQCYIIKKKDHH